MQRKQRMQSTRSSRGSGFGAAGEEARALVCAALDRRGIAAYLVGKVTNAEVAEDALEQLQHLLHAHALGVRLQLLQPRIAQHEDASLAAP